MFTKYEIVVLSNFQNRDNDMSLLCLWPRRRDRMVVGFTTACAVSAYHH
jgi:hypothetical protein